MGKVYLDKQKSIFCFLLIALKMTKCQTLKKFKHLEPFPWHLLFTLTLTHINKGQTSKKTPCMIRRAFLHSELTALNMLSTVLEHKMLGRKVPIFGSKKVPIFLQVPNFTIKTRFQAKSQIPNPGLGALRIPFPGRGEDHLVVTALKH